MSDESNGGPSETPSEGGAPVPAKKKRARAVPGEVRRRRRGRKKEFNESFPIKMTDRQWKRIKALNAKVPGMNRSHLLRTLIELALPMAEQRPEVLWGAPVEPRAQSA